MNISQKLISGLILMTVLTALIGYFAVAANQKVLEHSIVDSSFTLLEEMIGEIERNIHYRIEGLKNYSRDAALREFLIASNLTFDGLDNPQAYIAERDRFWKAASDEKITPFARELISNDISWKLREMMTFYEEEYGYKVYGEIFVANKYGANVAQTGKTSDYYQADEEWWQKAKENGIYLEDFTYDEGAKTYSLDIGVRIVDRDGNFLGVLKSAFNIEEVAGIFKHHRDKKLDSNFILASKSGKIIYSTEKFEFHKDFPKDIWDKIHHVKDRKKVVSHGRNLDGGGLYVHAHSHGFKDFKSLGWVIVERHRIGGMFAPVAELKNTILVMIIAMLFVGAIVGMAIANSILNPIESLRAAAVEISQGNLDAVVKVQTKDEIGFLAETFNKMATDLKEQRKQLVERSVMESLVESIREGMIMIDQENNVVVMNPQARRMLGFNDSEFNGYQALKEKMKLVDLDQSLRKSRRDNSLIQKEIIMPDNEKQILSCNICPVQSEGNNLGTAIILRDISLEKEVDAAKTEFISTVSHELRTPLAITKEGLSLVLDKIAGDITEKQEMILNTAQDNISRLNRLINNLLDISKIEAGKMEMRNVKLDITALTKKVVADFELKAKEKNLDLQVKYPEGRIDVFADRDKIIQVFTNLINNALKFTAEGSIEISARESGGFFEFTVADTGIGISRKDLERTFSKFQQFGRIAGEGEKGTGLGLSIAKGLVEMHGGTIKVESEIDVGTKFIFTLRKFSEDLLLQEFIQNRITEAQKSAEHLSLVMVNISKMKDPEKVLPVEKKQRHLKAIENLLNADLHRQGDLTFRDAQRCAALIANCDKGHINIICERIKGTMARYMAREEELSDKVDLEVGCATYPDDARNSIDLLNKVKAV